MDSDPSEPTDSNDSPQREIAFLPTGESCDNCNSTTKVRKFKGSLLCKSCRNQWAAING